MKITEIQTVALFCPYESPIGDAMSTIRGRQALLVLVHTDSGVTGIGEAFTYGGPMSVGKLLIQEVFAPVLEGEDPTDIERLWAAMYWRSLLYGRRGLVFGAISGIDIALWDILGKVSGQPVYKLLGGAMNSVPSYASGGFYAPGKGLDGLREEMEGYLKQGYTQAKMKIGRNHPFESLHPARYMREMPFSVRYEEDLQRISTVRDVLGNGRLIVDMNASWSAEQVIARSKDLLEHGVNWIEEPIQGDDWEGCSRISREAPGLAVCGFETEQGLRTFQRMLQLDAIDVVQPDIAWAGGFTEVRKIGAAAAAHSKPISLHSFGSAVHFAASLHMAAALPNTESIESEENFNPLKSNLIKGAFQTDKKMNFYLPDAPGLGIDLDWDAVERYAVT